MLSEIAENNVENIINEYLPKIKYYAYKLSVNLPSELSHDDLVSAGVIGLLESMGRYDSSKEASLKTFSDCRIKGAIIDEIRSMLWTSRDMRKKISAVRETYKSLEDKFSRPPMDNEVAAELGISVDKLHKVLMSSNMNHVCSLQDSVVGKNGETRELIDCISADEDCNPSELLEFKESRGRLNAAIKKLTEREALVVTLYYYEELTLKEIGSIVGLTESRICQLLNEAHLKLRDAMNGLQASKDM